MEEALAFVRDRAAAGEPFFAVVWYGSPHSPFVASAGDRAAFAGSPERSANHHAELVALDRSVGTLRAGLRDAGVAGNTLVWFCSDNGGLPGIEPPTTGGIDGQPLRGHKGTIFSGGLRVPAVVEWPAAIGAGRASGAVTCTSDILPTLCAACGVDPPGDRPLDGVNLLPLLTGAGPHWTRPAPLGFRQGTSAAWLDRARKLLTRDRAPADGPVRWELYDLAADPGETRDLAADRLAEVAAMTAAFAAWSASVDRSAAGDDYPVDAPRQTESRRFWHEDPAYAPFLDDWRDRPAYRDWLAGRTPAAPR